VFCLCELPDNNGNCVPGVPVSGSGSRLRSVTPVPFTRVLQIRLRYIVVVVVVVVVLVVVVCCCCCRCCSSFESCSSEE